MMLRDEGLLASHDDLVPLIAGKRIVTIGGGTGPFALLSRLKGYPCTITAIVSMADSGGSSRRLMDEFGQLPFGDLRQALVALSRKGLLWREVFAYRFGNGMRAQDLTGAGTGSAGISGHNLGNLVISALQELNRGNLLWAIEDAQELLDTAGSVLPVTLSHATLCAAVANGDVIRGETEIDTRGVDHPELLSPLTRIFLEPDVMACPDAIRALVRADLIILGPGDLYTSILPNLLVQGVSQAVLASDATKIYICNLMTKHGETDGYRASDFVREILRYLNGGLDRVILHTGLLPSPLLEMYAAQQQHPVVADVAGVRELVSDVVVDQLLAVHPDHLLRHDADRLIRAIFAHGFGAPAYAPHLETRTRHLP